jgi:hypothetical protein
VVNKPKAKGTAAETAFVNWLRTVGFPHAERRSLQGSLDKGDVTGTPGVCWEVKVADRGYQMAGWLRETEVERLNSNADHGVLICKPKLFGARSVGSWVAGMYSVHFDNLVARATAVAAHDVFDGGLVTNPRKASDISGVLLTAPNLIVHLCPPGKKDSLDFHYDFVQARTMVELLRYAGYGDPMEPE